MTDQEINDAVARKLGYHGGYENCKDCGNHHWRTKDHCNVEEPPAYSTDISAAWEIVEKLKNEGFGLRYGGGDWIVTNGSGMEYEEDISRADTAPKAICLAFLKLP